MIVTLLNHKGGTATVGQHVVVADAASWIKPGERQPDRKAGAGIFTARLTLDSTPERRDRIKGAALPCRATVTDRLRDLSAREIPATEGDPP